MKKRRVRSSAMYPELRDAVQAMRPDDLLKWTDGLPDLSDKRAVYRWQTVVHRYAHRADRRISTTPWKDRVYILCLE